MATKKDDKKGKKLPPWLAKGKGEDMPMMKKKDMPPMKKGAAKGKGKKGC
jgi:hypothetical protein